MVNFDGHAWPKGYEHRPKKISKKWFRKSFFKLVDNATFGKTSENVRKHRDTKLATAERSRNFLVS